MELLPLQSWNNTPTKLTILDFVTAVCDETGPDYVPSAERVAVFDNDGTLWCEHPVPPQLDFVLRRLAAMAKEEPSLREQQPWKAAYEQNPAWIMEAVVKHYGGDDSDTTILMGGILKAFGEMTVEEYETAVAQFFAEARHPTFDCSYFDVNYQPMIELLDYLSAHEFTVYIASGGGRDFMRTISQQMYNIPRERVIGSAVTHCYQEDEQGVSIVRQAEPDYLDDGLEKPVRIWNRCGRRPILIGGNANGDVAMMKYADANGRRSLCLLVNHDDGAREFAYTRGAEDALKTANDHGWTTVSIAEDWHAVFAFQAK